VKLRLLSGAILYVLAAVAASPGQVPPDAPGGVETLPAPQPHWVGVSDLILERMAFVDLDSGRFLGIINGGYGAIAPLFPTKRQEIYLPATYFARRTRGARTDVLGIYDTTSLAPVAEVIVPAKRAIDAVALAHSALSDDERFVAMFNWTPRTSLSIVDVEQRAFVGEVDIPGCSLVYSAGARRYFSLCADGSALVTTLDETGRESGKERTAPFFDPTKDPVTEKAVRNGKEWIFVSFDGYAHPVDVSGDQLRFGEVWSLLNDEDRGASWRIGGLQHLAVHRKTGRLYSLMHRGGADTHKDPGEEVWVYDLKTKQRLQRIALHSPGLTVYGFPVEFGRTWIWPFNRLSDWLLDTVVPAAVSHIQVTQDDEPRLLTATQFSGAIGVYDARNGNSLGRVLPTGWTSDLLLAPWGGR
jgi:methylamine dehydrogenase heavy chain